jgi:mono/diheme cytochrome c family protein
MNLLKRIAITLGALTAVLLLGLLFTYQVIRIDWVSMMEIQPSFRPLEDPLPVPAGSIPIEGAALLPGLGAPQNPVAADEVSLQRGQTLYEANCTLCHGASGVGDGPIGVFLTVKPANLTGPAVTGVPDGNLFVVVTYGVPGRMPPLAENLTPRDRWDVINWVRRLGNP